MSNARHLRRVEENIGDLIVFFCRDRLKMSSPRFHMEDLLEFVADNADVAPDSPGRILRGLRRKGLVRYRVVDRRRSLYEVLP